jgi:hypothetical protein
VARRVQGDRRGPAADDALGGDTLWPRGCPHLFP